MKKEKQIKSYTRTTKSGKTTVVKAHTAKYNAADARAEAAKKKKGSGEEFSSKASTAFSFLNKMSDTEFSKFSDYAGDVLDNSSATGSSRSSLEKLLKEDKKSAAYMKAGWTKYAGEYGHDQSSGKPKSNATTKSAKEKASKQSKAMKVPGFEKSPATTSKPKNGISKKETSPTPASVSSKEFSNWYHYPDSAGAKATAKQLRKSMGIKEYNKLNKQANDTYSDRGHLKLFKSLGSTEPSKKKGTTVEQQRKKLIATAD